MDTEGTLPGSSWSAQGCFLCSRIGWRFGHVAELRISKLFWTIFYLGNLGKKDDIRRFDVNQNPVSWNTIDRRKPRRTSSIFIYEKILLKYVLPSSTWAQHHTRPSQSLWPTQIFTPLFVVNVGGAGIDKRNNARYNVLRFPMSAEDPPRSHLWRHGRIQKTISSKGS